MSVADGKELTALFQPENDQRDSEAAFGALAAAVYESSSGGIADSLQGLLNTATEQLDIARKTEMPALRGVHVGERRAVDIRGRRVGYRRPRGAVRALRLRFRHGSRWFHLR